MARIGKLIDELIASQEEQIRKRKQLSEKMFEEATMLSGAQSSFDNKVNEWWRAS